MLNWGIPDTGLGEGEDSGNSCKVNSVCARACVRAVGIQDRVFVLYCIVYISACLLG